MTISAGSEALTTGGPTGWYPLAACRVAFSGYPAAAKKACQRWYQTLARERKTRRNGRCLVRGDAFLPNEQTVEQFAQHPFRCKVAAPVKNGTKRQRRKWLDAVELLGRFETFLSKHPHLPVPAENSVPGLNRS